jgi:protein-tyrosine phosphatase
VADTQRPTFESLDNFRDVGGVPTIDGRRVRTGRLYRSDSLTKLSEADATAFERLGIRTVVDLRRPTEIEEFGRIAEAVDRRYVNISPQHRLWDGTTYDEAAGSARFLADRYHDLTTEAAADIGEVIRVLAEATVEPTVVHCFAGKDRTGVVIALALSVVGVEVDAIADDYAVSNEWAVRFAATSTAMPAHWVFAPREAMTLYLAELASTYGSVRGYLLTTGIGDKEFDALTENLVI